jgi:hypothetical protein
MHDIELRIPVELTASRIERRASISAEAANQLAIELHAIVADYRQLFALRPPSDHYGLSEETDVIETILRTAVDVWPSDKAAAAVESMWLFERFDAVDGDELYERFLRLCCKISGTDLADFGLKSRW